LLCNPRWGIKFLGRRSCKLGQTTDTEKIHTCICLCVYPLQERTTYLLIVCLFIYFIVFVFVCLLVLFGLDNLLHIAQHTSVNTTELLHED
jgi:hypothetical protein